MTLPKIPKQRFVSLCLSLASSLLLINSHTNTKNNRRFIFMQPLGFCFLMLFGSLLGLIPLSLSLMKVCFFIFSIFSPFFFLTCTPLPEFLLFLALNTFSNRFGNFLFACEKARKSGKWTNTQSIWGFVQKEENLKKFRNEGYSPDGGVAKVEVCSVVFVVLVIPAIFEQK